MANYEELLVQLTASVERSTTVAEGTIVFLLGVPGLIQAATDAAIAAGATPEQTAAFDNLRSLLETKADELEAALLANTPEAPMP